MENESKHPPTVVVLFHKDGKPPGNDSPILQFFLAHFQKRKLSQWCALGVIKGKRSEREE